MEIPITLDVHYAACVMNIDFLTGCSRLHWKPYSFFTSEISFVFTVTGMMAVGFTVRHVQTYRLIASEPTLTLKCFFFLRYENI